MYMSLKRESDGCICLWRDSFWREKDRGTWKVVRHMHMSKDVYVSEKSESLWRETDRCLCLGKRVSEHCHPVHLWVYLTRRHPILLDRFCKRDLQTLQKRPEHLDSLPALAFIASKITRFLIAIDDETYIDRLLETRWSKDWDRDLSSMDRTKFMGLAEVRNPKSLHSVTSSSRLSYTRIWKRGLEIARRRRAFSPHTATRHPKSRKSLGTSGGAQQRNRSPFFFDPPVNGPLAACPCEPGTWASTGAWDRWNRDRWDREHLDVFSTLPPSLNPFTFTWERCVLGIHYSTTNNILHNCTSPGWILFFSRKGRRNVWHGTGATAAERPAVLLRRLCVVCTVNMQFVVVSGCACVYCVLSCSACALSANIWFRSQMIVWTFVSWYEFLCVCICVYMHVTHRYIEPTPAPFLGDIIPGSEMYANTVFSYFHTCIHVNMYA